MMFYPHTCPKSHNLLRLKGRGAVRKTTIRKLFHGGFDDLVNICPVLLTGPETACDILPLKSGLYDLVIIDEASQMFMADALPILYRAKSAVISGDKWQMPPSDFFTVGDDGGDGVSPDNDDKDEDSTANPRRLIAAEGEYCLLEAAEHSAVTGSPNKKSLIVHYRSDYKELIDFSNHAFYKGDLIAPTCNGNLELPAIFTAPIKLHKIDGQFVGGVNEIEAQVAVDKLKEIWSYRTKLSVGVIVFNISQRDKIEDLLFEEAERDPLFKDNLEKARSLVADDGEDAGFFVRSVEHVQGDERDLIILSTTYSGQSRNFGPITRKEKGRKRLNVAVTRARKAMLVISSLDINSISNDGERGTEKERYYLWQYLRYAEAISERDDSTAKRILCALNPTFCPQKTGKAPESPFEEEVATFLKNEGFYVEYQVGESSFRIDLGVKRNMEDLHYICGVECDGRQYHSSWNARMNDIWRQNILENKGWKIVRVWSSDWFNNQEKSKKLLLSKIRNQLPLS